MRVGVNVSTRQLRKIGALVLALAMTFSASCGREESFTAQGNTRTFVQDYNPPYVDVLWMLNTRSPMFRYKERFFSELQQFFSRLDTIPDNYKMAFVNHDSGKLQPVDSPIILEKTSGVGTVAERANKLQQLLNNVINLGTGATDRGLGSAWHALNTQFAPKPNVPLVLVFISDSDDHSQLPAGETDAVEFYSKAFLSLKGNKPELLRVYSVNYTIGSVPSETTRCATRYNTDIDNGGKNIYHKLAEKLGGVIGNKATADLCGSFASNIDLSGLTLKELPKRFMLDSKPGDNSILVAVTLNGQTIDIPWSYDSATNEIVFQTAPPEASVITVTFHATK